MAKISSRRLKDRAEQGATMIVRDRLEPLVDDEKSPYDGEFPPLLSREGKPCTLTLLGADSETAKRLDRQRSASAQNRVVASMFGKSKARAAMTPEDIAEQAQHDLDKLVTLTVGWYGWEGEDEEPVPFSAEAVRELYEQDPDTREQALQFIGDRAVFFARSSTLSVPSSSTSSASASAPATA
ncbi:MAG: hypothetical protein HEQ38_17005 [Gemmatimonas sp.]|nr:hypothetical protein [Gemmatimonas sp.]